jgi:hypothetical protein
MVFLKSLRKRKFNSVNNFGFPTPFLNSLYNELPCTRLMKRVYPSFLGTYFSRKLHKFHINTRLFRPKWRVGYHQIKNRPTRLRLLTNISLHNIKARILQFLIYCFRRQHCILPVDLVSDSIWHSQK